MTTEKLTQKTNAEIKADCEAQSKICAEKGWIHFAPHDGVCYDCRRNIFQNYAYPGKKGTEYITGCPHCHYSFCE